MNVFFYVVPNFYKLKNLCFSKILILVLGVIDHFWLDDFKEAFRYCVVPAVSFSTHALVYFICFKEVSEFCACVLNPSVREENQLKWIYRALFDRHFKSRNYRTGCIHCLAHSPTDVFPILEKYPIKNAPFMGILFGYLLEPAQST